MKKIIIVLLVLLYCIDSMGQAISNRSSATITVKDARWMAGLNAFVPVYPDTLTASLPDNIGIDSCGAIIFTYDNNDIWYRGCSPKRWLRVGSGQIINDTIYTERPIAVKVDSSGRHIIYFLTARGLISGGVVSLDSCMTIDVNNTVFNLNYNQYTVPQTTGIVISAADPTFGRVDRIVVDTNLNVVVIPGMPSSSPLPAPIDIFSQFELMQITIPAGATCLSISQRIIYDQNTEWTITTSGTITEDPDNTANPYHLTKAIFVSSYHNGSSIIFTDSSPDTVTAGELLKMFIYINGAFTNQISGQWYNGSTSVSNQISLNPYFNTNDSTKYQNLDVQFSAWNMPIGTEFDRLVLTFGGDDISGAKGLYLDYIQIQKGLTNINNELTLTTNGSSGASTYDNVTKVLNIPIYSGGGGSETMQQTFDNSVAAGDSTAIDLSGHRFRINEFLSIFPSFFSSELKATDGASANSIITLVADTANNAVTIQIRADKNTDVEGEAQIKLDGMTSTIVFQGDSGNIFSQGIVKILEVPHGEVTDSILTIGADGTVNMRDAASLGGNTIYTANDTLNSDRTVILDSKFLKFKQGNYNPFSIDVPNDTIALRINHSGGAVSSLKIGDNSSTPKIDMVVDDSPNGQTGELSVQAGGFGYNTNSTVSDQRTASFFLNTGGSQQTYTNTTTGSIADILSGINTGDHAYVSFTAENGSTSASGAVLITDTAVNVNSDLFRVLTNSTLSVLNTDNTGKVTFNQYGAGTFLGVATYGSAFDASGNIIEVGAFGSYVHTIFTPSTGNTISTLNNTYNIVNPAGALLALTVNLPSSPNDNDVVILKYTKAITTVTYANGTVVDGITSPIAGGFLILVYDSGSSSWY